jgi:tetratricopeptide (TPR) repeat protein
MSSPQVHYREALAALQRGDRDGAKASLRELEALAPDSAATCYVRGMIRLSNGNYANARADLAAVADALRTDAAVQANFGFCLQELGAHAAAMVPLDRAANLAPTLADAHFNRAVSLLALNRNADAEAALRRVLALVPDHPKAWARLAEALYRQDRADEAVAACNTAMGLRPDHAMLLKLRGLAHQSAHRLEQAADDILASAWMRYAPGERLPSDPPRELRSASRAKLRHDLEQLRHLQARGLLPNADALIASHEALMKHFAQAPSDSRTADLIPPMLDALAGGYNRLHHLAEAPRLSQGALAPTLDGAAIARDYEARAPGITWVDGLLRPEALQALRRYCQDSTFWFDFRHAGGYVGAFFEDGFAAPLLLQIAEELRAAMPGIFRDYPLVQLWAFKYDTELDGIELHADIAKVNVNFWITPDEANLDPDTGGLLVWDMKAPPEWGIDEFNTSSAEGQAKIRTYLEEQGAACVKVPYRENRAVIFDSDLFHRTDTLRFKPGYDNRRINVTMLFGRREGKTR